MTVKIPSEKDIYRSAKVLVEQMDAEALLHAMAMQARYHKADNPSGAYIWEKIGDAIIEMTMPEGLFGEHVTDNKAVN